MNNAKNIQVMFDKGFRQDRRKLREFRKIKIDTGVSANAEGSARVKIGDTEVIAGVKMSIEKPYSDTPTRGNLSVNVELLPLSNPNFEPGPPSIDGIELARVVDRGIRESECIDLHELCIEKGEKVWTMFLDICSINDAGNLRDAASLAAIAALKDARFPEVVDGEIDYKHKTDKGLPLKEIPIEITICKLGKHLFVDATSEEEEHIDARLTVATIADERVCAMQKGGLTPITIDEASQMIEIATQCANEIRKKLG